LGAGPAAALSAHFELDEVAPNQVLIEAGAAVRKLFLVLSGTARLLRGSEETGSVGPGDSVGELALIAARTRSATVIANTPMRVGCLTHERYEALRVARPELALALVEALLGCTADQLVEDVEARNVLVRERSLPRRTTVHVRIQGETSSVRLGTPIGELLPLTFQGAEVVAGLIDRKPVSLATPVSSDAELEPLTTASLEGQRLYRQSQALLLLEAARSVVPERTVRMAHSVGMGQRVTVAGTDPTLLPSLAVAIENKMRELVASDAPLREEWWTVDEARDYFKRVGWKDAAELLATWRDPAVPLVSYGEVYALSSGPLLSRTGRIEGFEVLVDRGGLLLMYGSRAAPRSVAPARLSSTEDSLSASLVSEALAVSQQTSLMTSDQEKWLATLGVSSVGAFNRMCIEGKVSELLRVSEGYQEKRISRIADEIAAREEVRVVCIAGPSSAGKTTFIKRLSVQLQVNGLNPVPLSLDDYYCDREKTPRDASGDYDFEALEALQLDLLREHVDALLRGEEVRTARYHFPTGKSQPGGGPPIRLRPTDLLMLEGIHGLNPQLLGAALETGVFRVFVCPLAQLPFDALTRVHASDVRLVRRIVRDRHSRGHNAADTIQRWPSVRTGERRHIFAYQHHADAVFDSSLIYELAVLKVYAERYLLEVPETHPACSTAFRLLQFLDRFVTIYPDHVPPTSILREFIGGSGFEY
jgi:uridine kinase